MARRNQLMALLRGSFSVLQVEIGADPVRREVYARLAPLPPWPQRRAFAFCNLPG